MSTIEIVIVALLLWGAINGFIKGFVLQSLTLIALVLGVWAAYEFHDAIGAALANWFSLGPRLMKMVAFSLIFILVLTGMHFLSRLITHLMGKSVLGKLNRIGGALFGVIKMAFILSVIIFIIEKFDANTRLIFKEQKESIIVKPILRLAPSIFPHLQTDGIKNSLL